MTMFRKVGVDDLDALYELKLETQNNTNDLFLKNKEEQLYWLESVNANANCLPLIYTKENVDTGFYYIRDIDWISRHHCFSYYLFKEHRGKKLSKGFLSDGINYSFNTLNMNKIYGEVLTNNHVSVNVIKSLGFQILCEKKNHCYKNDEYHNVLYFELEKQ